jgi:hypothetical protein
VAATIEQLLADNLNWSYAEVGIAYIVWEEATKATEARLTSHNTASPKLPPREIFDAVCVILNLNAVQKFTLYNQLWG